MLERVLRDINRLKPTLQKRERELKLSRNYYDSLYCRDKEGSDLSQMESFDCPFDRETSEEETWKKDRGMYPRALGPPSKPSIVCKTRDRGKSSRFHKDPKETCIPLPGIPTRFAASTVTRPAKLVERLSTKDESLSYSRTNLWPMYAERTWIQYLHLMWRLEDHLLQLMTFARDYGLKTTFSKRLIRRILYTVDFRWGYKAPPIVKPGEETFKGFSALVRHTKH